MTPEKSSQLTSATKIATKIWKHKIEEQPVHRRKVKKIEQHAPRARIKRDREPIDHKFNNIS
jgi:hypothetical protein